MPHSNEFLFMFFIGVLAGLVLSIVVGELIGLKNRTSKDCLRCGNFTSKNYGPCSNCEIATFSNCKPVSRKPHIETR